MGFSVGTVGEQPISGDDPPSSTEATTTAYTAQRPTTGEPADTCSRRQTARSGVFEPRTLHHGTAYLPGAILTTLRAEEGNPSRSAHDLHRIPGRVLVAARRTFLTELDGGSVLADDDDPCPTECRTPADLG